VKVEEIERFDAMSREGAHGYAGRGICGKESRGLTCTARTPLELQRKAQWRPDFVAAENSMGFHTPPEAARLFPSPSATRDRPKRIPA